jgi:valyl-tRNA synthetase
MMNLDDSFVPGLPEELDLSDKWVLSTLNNVVRDATENLEKYEMGLAAAKVQNFIWDVYCDWFIEIAKVRLNSGDEKQADNARKVLVYVLDQALKLLHPFMPFVTEKLYQALPGSAETIMTQDWPVYSEAFRSEKEEADFEKIVALIKAVRTVRTDMNVHPTKRTHFIIETATPDAFASGIAFLEKFAFATEVTLVDKFEGDTNGMVQVITETARAFMPLMELIDRDKELARLNKEKARIEGEIARAQGKLNNAGFVAKAPAHLIEAEKEKLANNHKVLESLTERIAEMESMK